jgi:hypothetical protein
MGAEFYKPNTTVDPDLCSALENVKAMWMSLIFFLVSDDEESVLNE